MENVVMTVTWNGGKKTYSLPKNADESEIWKKVAENLLEMTVPNKIAVEVENVGDAVLNVIKRGTFTKGGTKWPSPYVICERNTIDAAPAVYPEKYLTCINAESGVYGNYKFYRFEPHNTYILGEYGRIGARQGEMYAPKKTEFETYMFWIRYYEKLAKGYTDQSEVYLGELAEAKEKPAEEIKEETKDIFVPNKTDAELYAMLKAYAKSVVENSLISVHITQKQIDESRKIWAKLGKVKTVKTFNKHLMELMTISPRRVMSVKSMLADSPEDFGTIIDREESLILSMEALVNSGANGKVETAADCFEKDGIEVREPTQEESRKILDLLIPEYQKNVEKIYMVKSPEQENRYTEYCKERKIKKRELLLHGSRNCNWLSIIRNSLMLNPNAQITGKGLGYGIYFGNSVIKCSHYTFSNDRRIMVGVFEVAYGNPLKITDQGHYAYANHTEKELMSKKKDCLHYTRVGCDWADEIVVYNEAALSMRALIIMKK